MRTLPRPGRRGFATLRVARRLLWPASMTSPSTLRHRSLILFFCARLAYCYRQMGLEHKADQYQSFA